MENTENKTDEVEILVNTGYGGFRLPSIAKVWLMQLGYTSDQAMYMGRGTVPAISPTWWRRSSGMATTTTPA